jgi:hypothetical protein
MKYHFMVLCSELTGMAVAGKLGEVLDKVGKKPKPEKQRGTKIGNCGENMSLV